MKLTIEVDFFHDDDLSSIHKIQRSAARHILYEAYKQGMTQKQGYVWFLPNWYSFKSHVECNLIHIICDFCIFEMLLRGNNW